MFGKNQNKNINFQNNPFRERFLLNLQIGNIFKTPSGVRAKELNDEEASTRHNIKMKEEANKEMQTPLTDIVKNTRDEIKKITEIGSILKEGAKGTMKAASSIITTPIAAAGNTTVNLVSGTTKIATQLVTNPVGLALNLPRIGADAVRLAVRPPLIFADYLASLIGRPSKWVKDFREFSIKKIDSAAETVKKTCAGLRDRILKIIGLGEGGPAHAALPAH